MSRFNSLRLFVPLLYLVGFSVLNAAVINPTENPPTHQTIENSDAIVVGSFVLDQISPGSKNTFINPQGRKIEGVSFVVPFKVEGTLKGIVDSMININLFYPSDTRDAIHWLLPLKAKLILFLKKDADGRTFYLVDPGSSWLIVNGEMPSGSTTADPANKVIEGIVSFLKFHLAHPEIKYEYPYAPNSPKTGILTYPQTDPSIIRSLRVGQNMGLTNKEFIEVAEQYVNQPDEIGRIARLITISSGNYGKELQRLADYNNGKLQGDDKFNVPGELYMAIAQSDNLNGMMPLLATAFAGTDSRLRLFAARALHQNKSKGKQMYPMIVKLLSDPDQEVQYQAMGCMFDLSGSIKQRPGERDIEFPAYAIFQENPNLYLNKCMDWWAKHKDSLK